MAPSRKSKSKSKSKSKQARARPPAKLREAKIPVTRVQTGVRIEKRILKVLKALAEYYEISLGDLLEGIVLHAFEGRSPFDEDALERIAALEAIYELDLDASASHRLE